MKQPLDAEDFARATGATPEQVERIGAVLSLLQRWQRRINLVGGATLADAWRRHVLDSAQLVPLLPPGDVRLADLGSGAGFPGLVVAILSTARVTLVESDARKCAFLAEAARAAATALEIRAIRIESTAPLDFDVVTARALAPLPRLLELASNWLAPHGFALLLKGRGVAFELTEADKTWKMRATRIPSRSDPSGHVLKIEQMSRRDDR